MADDEARLLSGEAWRDFCRQLERSGAALLGEDFPQAPRERAEGFRALTRLLAHALRMEVEAGDPDHPSFVRYEEPFTQWGGPNPDNVYLRARVAPGRAYRVWGDVRGVRQAIFSLHEGDLQEGLPGVYGERSLDQLAIGSDGALEIRVAEVPQEGNWIRLDPQARLFAIRIFQSDWERDATPPFFIERLGAEAPPPPLEPAALARALARSATWVERSVGFWNRFTRDAWQRGTPNVASPARAVPGGADHIRYGSCPWQLEPDEALLLCCEVPDADYWGFALHTLGWLESGDFANRQTSLSGHQLHVDGDGRVRIALASRDPGVPNWIDSEERGLLVYRFVWARTAPTPEAVCVPLAELASHLPADHPRVTPEDRRRALARRRTQVWRRYL
jgi:hypothetical protein